MSSTRGPVRQAVEASIRSGDRLTTPARGASFTVARVDEKGIVLLLGANEAWTPLRWECIEGIVPFLRARGWVEIGSHYETTASPDTLDGYLKGCLKRATAASGRRGVGAGGRGRDRSRSTCPRPTRRGACLMSRGQSTISRRSEAPNA